MSERDAFGPNLRRIRVQRGISVRPDRRRPPTSAPRCGKGSNATICRAGRPASTRASYVRELRQGDRRRSRIDGRRVLPLLSAGRPPRRARDSRPGRDRRPPGSAVARSRTARPSPTAIGAAAPRHAPPQGQALSAPAAAVQPGLRPPSRAAARLDRSSRSWRARVFAADLRPPRDILSDIGYDRRMRLDAVVAVSRAVAGTAGRLEKVGAPGRSARPRAARRGRDRHRLSERRAASGADEDRRRAALRRARRAAGRRAACSSCATSTPLFDRIAAVAGAGSSAARAQLLRELMSAATADEQDFLFRLLFGELRQGALEGVLTDAVARASGIPAARIRRAAMLAGDLAPVARAALAEGEAGLAPFALRPFQPVQPMLADSADDIGDALDGARRGVVRIQARWRAHPGPQGGRRGARVFAQPARRDRRRARDRRRSRARCRRARWCSTAKRSSLRPDGSPVPVSGHDAALRPEARRRSAEARRCRSRRCSSTRCISTASRWSTSR